MNSFSFGGHDDSVVCLNDQSPSGSNVVLENGSRRQSNGFRKNIRDVLDSSQLHMVTLEAQKAEFERILRMQEQQKMVRVDILGEGMVYFSQLIFRLKTRMHSHLFRLYLNKILFFSPFLKFSAFLVFFFLTKIIF